MAETFEEMLTGGHPNSLGRTVEVVDVVLADPARFHELFGCYESADAVVRLRTSSAIKRVAEARPDLIDPYLDRLISEVGALDQASAQWTLAQLFLRLEARLSADQRKAAQALMQRNLSERHDWIVLNTTMETLSAWAKADPALADWLGPEFERLSRDPRKSVARRAARGRAALCARGKA